MTLRTTLQNLIRRDPAISLREQRAATAARVEAFKPAAASITPVPPAPLAQACDQAVAEWNAIPARSEAEDWGDEQLDEALDAYGAVFRQAITVPSRDVAEVQAKARLLLHDLIAHTTGHDPSDETTLTDDELLMRVVLREIADLSGDIEASDDGRAASVEEAASLDFTAYTFDTPTRDPNGWMKEFAAHAIGMHIADRTLRMTKPELVAFIQKGGERDADTPVLMLQALDAAQKTFEGWGKMLSLASTRYLVAGSSAVLEREGAATAEGTEPEAEPEAPLACKHSASLSLVSMIDLASASLEDLQALHDTANLIGDAAYAVCWQARCKARGSIDDYNAAGKLMHWLGDALTDVETAAINEARRRSSDNPIDRERRLHILAGPVVENGDPDQIEAFARELLAHAKSERERR